MDCSGAQGSTLNAHGLRLGRAVNLAMLFPRIRSNIGCSLNERRTERQQISRIDCQSSKARAPVQMWPRHATRRSNETNLLSALDRIAGGHERLAHVEIPSHDSVAMVDV